MKLGVEFGFGSGFDFGSDYGFDGCGDRRLRLVRQPQPLQLHRVVC